MKTHRFSKHVGRGAFLLICTMAVCLLSCISEAQELDHYLGRVRFTAEYSATLLPANVNGVFFDTSACLGYRDSLPAWRFINSLKVDSIVHNGHVIPLTDQSQISGIVINSNELTNCMKKYKVYLLAKSFPGVAPYDTLIWSSIRQKYVVVPDLAQHFSLRFDDSVSVDTVIASLRSIDGLTDVEKRYRVYSDSCDSPDQPRTPNDPMINTSK